MAVFAAPRRQGGNHGMAQSRKYASAFAAVVQRIFLEGFRQPISCRGSDNRDPNVRPESLAVTLGPLVPLRWSIAVLVDACCRRGSDNRVRTEGVAQVVAEHRFLSRARISDVQWP